MNKMGNKNLDKKFECPEGFKECVALEVYKSGGGITLEKTGSAHAVLTTTQEYLGDVYCSNPQACIKKYMKKVVSEQTRRPAQIK